MGIYNYCQEKLRSPLNQKECFLCNHMFIPYNQTPELDCLQYKCSNCNPGVIIELSGSMLVSTLYDALLANRKAVQMLIKKIRNCKERNFAITTMMVSELLIKNKTNI